MCAYNELKNGEFSGTDKITGELVHWKFGELDWQAWMRFLDNKASRVLIF